MSSQAGVGSRVVVWRPWSSLTPVILYIIIIKKKLCRVLIKITYCYVHTTINTWQLPWFAHAARQFSLIEIGRRGGTRGSVLPGIRVTMRFYFMLGLVLVTSDSGITAECAVNMPVNTSTAHICAFCETRSLCKNAKCDAYGLFCGTNSCNRRAEDQPGVWFFLRIFTDSDYSRPNSFRPPRPGSGSSISSKYVRIIRSLATRTLGIPKLLKCINKAQPERSWSGAGAGAML